jgi:LytS/YehU family sensor histidine kinase
LENIGTRTKKKGPCLAVEVAGVLVGEWVVCVGGLWTNDRHERIREIGRETQQSCLIYTSGN